MTATPQNIDREAPLLFFDSGIGGMSVVRAVRAALPNAPIVYAADYAGLPYGTKSEAEIAARVPALLGRLVERYRPRLVTIACNTACTIALSHVRAALDVPVVGTVPAIKPAAAQTKSGVIGVLATPGTVSREYTHALIHTYAYHCKVFLHGAKRLAEIAEAKLKGHKVSDAELRGLIPGRTDW